MTWKMVRLYFGDREKGLRFSYPLNEFKYLQGNKMPRIRNLMAKTIHTDFGLLSTKWEEDFVSKNLQNYLFQHGTTHQILAGLYQHAEEMTSDFAYSIKRLRCGSPGCVYDLMKDIKKLNLLQVVLNQEFYNLWERFFVNFAHLISSAAEESNEHEVLFQLALEVGTKSPISQKANEFLISGGVDWSWLHRVKASNVFISSACTLVIPNASAGKLLLSESILLAWTENVLSFWDIDASILISEISIHEEQIAGVIQMSKTTIFTWCIKKAYLYDFIEDVVQESYNMSDLLFSIPRIHSFPSRNDSSIKRFFKEKIVGYKCGFPMPVGTDDLVWWRQKRFTTVQSHQNGQLVSQKYIWDESFQIFQSVLLPNGSLFGIGQQSMCLFNSQGETILELDKSRFEGCWIETFYLMGDEIYFILHKSKFPLDSTYVLLKFSTTTKKFSKAISLPEYPKDFWKTALYLPNGEVFDWWLSKTVIHYNIQCEVLGHLAGHTEYIEGIMYINAEQLVTWTKSEIIVWNQSTYDVLHRWDEHPSDILGVQLGENDTLLSWSQDTILCYSLHDYYIKQTIVSEGNRLTLGITYTKNGELITWKRGTLLEARSLRQGLLHQNFITTLYVTDVSTAQSASYCKNGDLITCIGPINHIGSELIRWDLVSGVCVGRFVGHSTNIQNWIETDDGRIISWSEANLDWRNRNHSNFKSNLEACIPPEIRVWSVDGECLHVMRGHNGNINSVLPLKDNKLLTWTWEPYELGLWSLEDGSCISLLLTDSRTLGAAQLENKELMTWSKSNQICFRSFDNGRLLRTLDCEHNSSLFEVIQVNQAYLACLDDNHPSISLCNFIEQIHISQLQGHSSPVLDLQVVSQKHLLSWSMDRTIRIWDLQTSLQSDLSSIVSLISQSRITCSAILSDEFFLIGKDNGTIEIINACTGTYEKRCVEGVSASVATILVVSEESWVCSFTNGYVALWSINQLTVLRYVRSIHPEFATDLRKIDEAHFLSWGGYEFIDPHLIIWSSNTLEIVDVIEVEGMGVSNVDHVGLEYFFIDTMVDYEIWRRHHERPIVSGHAFGEPLAEIAYFDEYDRLLTTLEEEETTSEMDELIWACARYFDEVGLSERSVHLCQYLVDKEPDNQQYTHSLVRSLMSRTSLTKAREVAEKFIDAYSLQYCVIHEDLEVINREIDKRSPKISEFYFLGRLGEDTILMGQDYRLEIWSLHSLESLVGFSLGDEQIKKVVVNDPNFFTVQCSSSVYEFRNSNGQWNRLVSQNSMCYEPQGLIQNEYLHGVKLQVPGHHKLVEGSPFLYWYAETEWKLREQTQNALLIENPIQNQWDIIHIYQGKDRV